MFETWKNCIIKKKLPCQMLIFQIEKNANADTSITEDPSLKYVNIFLSML